MSDLPPAAPPSIDPASTDPALTDTLSKDAPPDHVASNPASPHYDEASLTRGIGIRFKGVERNNVDEYCVSEGWVRMAVAGSRDRKGNPITIKQAGEVEAYWRS